MKSIINRHLRCIDLGLPPKGGFYYNNEIWHSDSYQSLTISARELLHCFLNELRWTGKGEKKRYINNGKISFTESQYKKRYGYSSATYISARNQLIEVGLIRQTYRGGMCRGDCAQYKLLFLIGTPLEKQKWRNYPKQNWDSDIPKAKENMVGVKTRFKKGKSSRKIKATLPK